MVSRGHPLPLPAGALAGGPAAREQIARTRMFILESRRTEAELLYYYCAAGWGFDVVGVGSTAAEGVPAVERTQPDLVLTSLDLPDLDAEALIARLRRAAPDAKLVGLVAACPDRLLDALTHADCHGLFHSAGEGMTELGQIIEQVRQGLRAVSPYIAQCLAALRHAPDAFPKLLTKREQEMLVCIAHAMTDEEIGRHLCLSSETAHFHRKKIMGKLGIQSTPKLIHYCVEKGFRAAPPPPPRHNPAGR